MKRRDVLMKAGLGIAGLSVAPLRRLAAQNASAGLRRGLIGTGRRAWQHIETINRSAGARIVAAGDIWNKRLVQAAHERCHFELPR